MDPRTAATAGPPGGRPAAGADPASPRTAACPFCPGNEHQTPPELARTGAGDAGSPGWHSRAFPNLYPIAADGVGTHEVVAISADHDRSIGRLNSGEAVELFDLLGDRVAEHERAGYAFSQVIVNHGRAAGASVEHPHAQVLALHARAPAIAAEAGRLGRTDCVLCALVAEDATPASGLVVVEGDAPAWCPRASALPYEMLLAPREHRATFHGASDGARQARAAVAGALRDALGLLDAALDDPPYNVVVHAPPFTGRPDFHWHVHVWPRIGSLAGFELGTGLGANTVLPEDAAALLRGENPRT